MNTQALVLISVLYGVTPVSAVAQTETKLSQRESNPEVKPEAQASSQDVNAKKETTKKSESPQKVTIQASRQNEYDVRRNSIAGKIVVGREELDKDGDATVGEILKRLPGVTIGGRPGRGGDIRMRGMGGGYTQILLNGERPPRGFSMESLSPDQVERIEIMRGPVAEFSTQAIAGTINIVLREDYHVKDSDLKMALGSEQGRLAPSISLAYPGQSGELQYVLSATLSRNTQYDFSQSHKQDINSLGTEIRQDQTDETQRHSRSLQVTPRLSYKFENADSLNVQAFLMNSHSDSRSESALSQNPVSNAPYANAIMSSENESTFTRFNSNYQHRFEQSGKLLMRLGAGVGSADSHSQRLQTDAQNHLLNTIVDTNGTRDSSWSLSAKYTNIIAEKQNLSTGIEIESGSRQQTRTSLDNGRPQYAESGDNLDAGTRRIATYLQDEFDIDAQWSAYAGLRWEEIASHSTRGTSQLSNQSRVLNPIVHAVYRIPNWGRDQIRMSVTTSYRAPSLNDLIAVPTISPLNSPTRPDRTGNPDLKPELSRGLDFAFEHYFKHAGIASANIFMRNIDQLIRRQTNPVQIEGKTRWINAPSNIGHALAKGIELETKVQLQEFWDDAPAIDLRANYSRFWSSVDNIPGPNNRLDQQPTQTANLGFDYRAHALPLSMGANFNWTPAYTNQNSESQTTFTGIKRQIDSYLLWKISSTSKLRFSVNNLQASDFLSASSFTTDAGPSSQQNLAKTFTTFSLRLELKL